VVAFSAGGDRDVNSLDLTTKREKELPRRPKINRVTAVCTENLIRID
jgi:hypothetical protein